MHMSPLRKSNNPPHLQWACSRPCLASQLGRSCTAAATARHHAGPEVHTPANSLVRCSNGPTPCPSRRQPREQFGPQGDVHRLCGQNRNPHCTPLRYTHLGPPVCVRIRENTPLGKGDASSIGFGRRRSAGGSVRERRRQCGWRRPRGPPCERTPRRWRSTRRP
jgi:hypothetical protein